MFGNWSWLKALLRALAKIKRGAVPGDFDSDGLSDLAYMNSSDLTWHIRSSATEPAGVNLGLPWAVPVPGDYDGDGKIDVAFWDPQTGMWFIQDSSGGPLRADLSFLAQGVPLGDITGWPVPGYYDPSQKISSNGFKKANLGIWSDGYWHVHDTSTGAELFPTNVKFGEAGDIPVPSDYDGDGITDLAFVRGNEWHIRGTQTGNVVKMWPLTNPPAGWSDIPVPGDYDGDGMTDLAVFRPRGEDGSSAPDWLINYSSTGPAPTPIQFGNIGDLPVPGYYTHSKTMDLAVWRPGTNEWRIKDLSAPALPPTTVNFGAAADIQFLQPLLLPIPLRPWGGLYIR